MQPSELKVPLAAFIFGALMAVSLIEVMHGGVLTHHGREVMLKNPIEQHLVSCPKVPNTQECVCECEYGSVSPDAVPTKKNANLLVEKMLDRSEVLTSTITSGVGVFPKTQANVLDWARKQHAKGDPQVPIAPEMQAEQHHFQYGLPWVRGRHQFEYMVARGLQPHHAVLEVGAGSGRAGVHIIDYLNKNRYFANDIDKFSLRAFMEYEVPLHSLLAKEPVIVLDNAFDLVGKFGAQQKYDYVLAFAVLIHLKPEKQKVAVENILAQMNVGGKLILSHRGPDGISFEELEDTYGLKLTFNEMWYSYFDREWFVELTRIR